MFKPPYCPRRHCPFNKNPLPGFYKGHGSYSAKCRSKPIPRFRCLGCKRTFSRQTFRADIYDHRPSLNQTLFKLLTSGVGLRQSARFLGLSRRCTELKARKLGRHLRRLNFNLQRPLPEGCELQFDEFETYETRRNTRPLTVPLLIEAKSRVIIAAESATIRPRGRMSKKRLRAIQQDEDRFGPRKDRSVRSIRRILKRGFPLVKGHGKVHFETDEKLNYPDLIAESYPDLEIRHGQTSSKLLRTTKNPLFAINQTEAIARCLTGRIRRESWLVSKKRRYLDIGLQLFITYRNFVRRRHNDDELSAAQHAGWVSRRMKPGDVLSWRQEEGRRSLHPLSRRHETIEQLTRGRG